MWEKKRRVHHRVSSLGIVNETIAIKILEIRQPHPWKQQVLEVARTESLLDSLVLGETWLGPLYVAVALAERRGC
jgi:hypothetical protein